MKYLDKGVRQSDITEEKKQEDQPEREDDLVQWTKKDAYK